MYEIRMNGSRNIPYLTLLLQHLNKVYNFALTVKICFCENNKSHQNLHAQKPSLILLSVDNTLQLLVYFKSAVKYMARVFATFRLHGRPGHDDGCQSALWDCFEEHIFNMVANLSPKIVPQCTLTTWSRPGLLRATSVANTAFTNQKCMWDHAQCLLRGS